MSKIVKLMTAVAFAAIAHVLFAYNGGYENSCPTNIVIGGRPYKGFGNKTLSARQKTGYEYDKGTTIERGAYAQCTALKTVDLTGVTTIGDAAFAYSALESVEIPANCSLGFISFGACKNLSSVTINDTNFLPKDGENKEPFRDCAALKTVIAKCGPPEWNFSKVFSNVTVRVSLANLKAWQDKTYPGVTVQEVETTSYKVTFDKNGADTCNAQYKTVTYHEPYGTLAVASKKGHSFLGWFTTGGTKVTAATIVTAKVSHSLIAHWQPNQYKLTFDTSDCDSCNAQYKTITYHEKYSTLAKPTKKGYQFLGWCTSGGTLVTADTVVTVTSSQTLYPKWAANQYKLTFDTSDCDTCNAQYKTITYHEKYGTLAKPTKKGYQFLGWFTSGGTQVTTDMIVTVTSSQTVYPKWAVNQYKLTFDKKDAETCNAQYKTITYHEPYGTLAKATKGGYTLAGWFTSGGTQVYPETVVTVTSSQTLVPKWAKNGEKHKVTFNGNGADTMNAYYKTVTVGQTFGTLAKVTRKGYAFAGWWTAKTGGHRYLESDVVGLLADVTLYAQWQANQYKLTFDKNGGDTCNAQYKTITYHEKYGVLAKATRAGYTFAGWYTSGGTRISEDTIVTVMSSQTVYAHWNKSSSSVRTTLKSSPVGGFDNRGGVLPQSGGGEAVPVCLHGVLADGSGSYDVLFSAVGETAYARIVTEMGEFVGEVGIEWVNDRLIVLTEDGEVWELAL